jgi:hypothetical protein
MWTHLDSLQSLAFVSLIPSPLAGEGKDKGAVNLHPHLDPLPSRERRPERKKSIWTFDTD